MTWQGLGGGAAGGATPAGPSISVGVGPFYVTNTAHAPDGNLNFTSLPGDPVHMTGRVFGGPGGRLPLADAKIEVWHADASGSYHPNAPGDATSFRREDLALRGFVSTGTDGRYQFTSIYPGKYRGRCRHYHLRVSAAGHTPVSTQLMFPALPGDVETPETDFVAALLPPAHRLTLIAADGVQSAEFDFFLPLSGQ